MKTSELKKMIKESVREVIQEELKDILLEALRSPKSQINENFAPYSPPNIPNQYNTNPNSTGAPPPIHPTTTSINPREEYKKIMDQMMGGQPLTTDQFIPGAPAIGEGTALGPGEVSMDQITALMNSNG